MRFWTEVTYIDKTVAAKQNHTVWFMHLIILNSHNQVVIDNQKQNSGSDWEWNSKRLAIKSAGIANWFVGHLHDPDSRIAKMIREIIWDL